MAEDPQERLTQGLKVIAEAEAAFEAKMRDPERRLAWELVQQGEALFFKKQYDLGIEKLVEASRLDPEYEKKVEAYRSLKEERLRTGPVKLGVAINRILMPRLHALGFAVEGEPVGAKWREGCSISRRSPTGRTGAVLLGRTKFGKVLGLNVSRHHGDKANYLDLGSLGFPRDTLKYLNQAELEQVLERAALAFEGPIVRWLDEPY